MVATTPLTTLIPRHIAAKTFAGMTAGTARGSARMAIPARPQQPVHRKRRLQSTKRMRAERVRFRDGPEVVAYSAVGTAATVETGWTTPGTGTVNGLPQVSQLNVCPAYCSSTG